jgi:uncharacterized protein (TIGR02145 family)
MVQMKKIILLSFLFLTNNLFGQTFMNLYYKNGNVMIVPIANVDSMYYVVNSSTCPSTLVDIDGNVYNTVVVGSQCWMKENLKTTHFNNGATIASGLTNVQWSSTTSGACTDYNNDTANTSKYGKLYNWYALNDPAGLCPVGWHEPKLTEWNVLIKTIDANADTNCVNCTPSLTAGGDMKEAGILHWLNPNTGATNSSGFTALPGGVRNGSNGYYSQIDNYAYFWSVSPYSTTTTYYFSIRANDAFITNNNVVNNSGFSVRCIKD